MKIALVADQLLSKAGSERVFQHVCEEFPDADVYTFVHDPESTFPYFANRQVRTPRIPEFLNNRRAYLWSFPFATYLMENLPLRGYDVVLSCSATVAKYVRPRESAHLCYCYIPTRALWQSDEYFGDSRLGRLIRPALGVLRWRDARAARKVNAFLTISQASQNHIRNCYGRESDLLYCPIDTERFRPQGKKKDHFLIVSRLERWKKVDYAVEAFRRLGYPLRVIGEGPEEQRLRSLAGPSTEFVGMVTDEQLAIEYSMARAVVFTPFIEGGMTPVEANACGTPTICFGAGGLTEVQIPRNGPAERGLPTSVFFNEQTPDALITAIHQFEQADFDQQALVLHADQYSVPRFRRQMRKFVKKFAA